MLDTSRNYYGVNDILRTIKAMSFNKLNVFHWHITDSHSFPLVVPSEPELAAKGSYGPQMQYSPDDVKRIVEFGLAHGVRVIPEIDAPGKFSVFDTNVVGLLSHLIIASTSWDSIFSLENVSSTPIIRYI